MTNEKGSVSILPKQMGFVSSADQKPQLQPVDTRLFTADAEASKPFDGHWSAKLVCDDSRDKNGLVQGYTWMFDVKIEQGKMEGQYGQIGSPGSGTFIGQVQREGDVDIEVNGNTGKSEYTVGKVARGTAFSYPMKGKFSGTTGHATRTKLRPCEITFTRE
jgi:hypothetical protein